MTTQEGTGCRFALDNALLEVTQPVVLSLAGRTDASFNVADGQFYLFFGFRLLELYLPDPYVGSVTNLVDPTRGDAGRKTSAAAVTSISSGYIGSEVSWIAPGKVTMRLGDTGHTHPATAPTTEASSTVQVNSLRDPSTLLSGRRLACQCRRLGSFGMFPASSRTRSQPQSLRRAVDNPG